MRSKKAAYSVINSSHVAQVKSAWQTGCWAANTFFARSRLFAKVSFVYKDRSLCAQQPICDNSLFQSALCFLEQVHWFSVCVQCHFVCSCLRKHVFHAASVLCVLACAGAKEHILRVLGPDCSMQLCTCM